MIAAVCSWFAWKYPKWGVRSVPIMGLILAAALVGWLLHRDVPDLEVWPILLGGAAFFYLWWLAALLFDLTLVWHYYMRWAAVADHLRTNMKEVHDTTPPAHG